MILGLRLALCLLAAGLSILQAQGTLNNALDCCESTRDTPLSIKRLPLFLRYEIQEPNRGCSIRAFVLITRHGRGLCYPLESKVAAVFKKGLDERKARKLKKSMA
ncbi:uncharacterized protein PHA67_007353 isoform 1-T2 [Liasis olivaceus]